MTLKLNRETRCRHYNRSGEGIPREIGTTRSPTLKSNVPNWRRRRRGQAIRWSEDLKTSILTRRWLVPTVVQYISEKR
jgi:hypothetical protein